MKPTQAWGTLMSILDLISMGDKVFDLQKSEMIPGYLIKTVLTFYDLFLPFPAECLRLMFYLILPYH